MTEPYEPFPNFGKISESERLVYFSQCGIMGVERYQSAAGIIAYLPHWDWSKRHSCFAHRLKIALEIESEPGETTRDVFAEQLEVDFWELGDTSIPISDSARALGCQIPVLG